MLYLITNKFQSSTIQSADQQPLLKGSTKPSKDDKLKNKLHQTSYPW